VAAIYEVPVSRWVLTGFEAFGGEKINPSAQLAEAIGKDPEFQSWVDTLILPVSFKKAPEILLSLFSDRTYDAVIMLGQAGGRSKINLERVSLNWVETPTADENGYKPKTGLIDPAAEKALFTPWPLAEIEKHLKNLGIPAEISFSAGSFVCNYLYFKVASEFALMKKSCLFVHVPYLPEQAVAKNSAPSLDFETMKKGIIAILRFMKDRTLILPS
jgi:pyroglutamyl-peptidase